MKNMLLLIAFLTYCNISFAQPDGCDNDTIAPTFELPMYLTDGIIYECLDSVPLLTGPPWPDVMDLVFETLEDNCLSPEWAPWYGPTLSAGILDQTDSSITYTFTGYDDAPNYNSQQMTFYFSEECAVDTINTGLGKYRGLIEDVTVYPNPSNGEFIVTSKYAYEIVDYMGIIQDKDNLESGVYLIRIRGQYLKNKLVIHK